MAYATVEDIQARFARFTFGVDSPITTSQVESFLRLSTSQINSIVRKRYLLPIRLQPNIEYLESINIEGAYEQVQSALGESEGEVAAAVGLLRQTTTLSYYRSLLLKLDKPNSLPGETRRKYDLNLNTGLYFPEQNIEEQDEDVSVTPPST